MDNDVDVVIVGAGAAGLAAAKAAARKGLSCALVEASHRIGGRAYTENFPSGDPFDLGCHWMHSASINPFVAIADTHGFAYRRGDTWQGRIHHHGATLGDDAAREVERLEEADEAAIAKAAVNGDPCVADVMNLESPWAPYLAYWFSLGASCDPDQTGVADVTAYNDTSENWPVVDGYGALVAAWGADVPVTLNAAAERIRVTRDGVHVATAQGAVRGRTALVTVSTAMLASGRIAFEPGLPDWKLAAIRELPLGVHNRIAVMLDGLPPDPGDRCAMTVMTRDDEVPMALDVAPYGHAYVVGLTGGRFGAWLERTGQGPASVDYVVERVRTAWGSQVARRLTDHAIVTAWHGDPWTLGSYSAAAPGQAHQRAALARPVDDRLFFAGEATSPDFFSTCHGAYLSGRRAIDEVDAVLRPDGRAGGPEPESLAVTAAIA